MLVAIDQENGFVIIVIVLVFMMFNYLLVLTNSIEQVLEIKIPGYQQLGGITTA